jgi:hydroxyacylglutathione hydrolase
MTQIESFFIGPMDNIVYIVSDTHTKECLVIDPAWDVPQLIHHIKTHQLTLKSILLTHGHHDHTNGLDDLLAYRSVPVYLSQQEAVHLTPLTPHLVPIENQHQLSLGTLTITAYTTPGHTPGGLCYQIDSHLFTGDTLFVDGCGRCDLESSDVNQMYDSLQWIKSLSDNIMIYPGHNYGDTSTDTIGSQKKQNRFLTCETREIFIRKRMRS